MSDTKARRVRLGFWLDMCGEQVEDDPSGTHMLVPVEAWERVVGALRDINEHGADWIYSGAACAEKARRTLAGIGGGDE